MDSMKSCRLPVAAAVIALVCGFAVSGGCLSVLSQSPPAQTAASGNGAVLHAALIDQEADWGLSRGCTWTATFQVSNQGSVAVQDKSLHIELVNARTGAVRDAKDIYIGGLDPGQATTVRVVLDGECLDEYTVRAVPA